MATLKDLQFSQTSDKGETRKSSKVQPDYEIMSPESFTGSSVGVTPNENSYVIFRLVKKKRGRIHIDGICDVVMNPKTNKRERIWLLNGADSIWQSEILELLKDKEYVRRNRRSLTFEDGVLRIPIWDDRALEFARANTKNVGKNRSASGKFDFYEYNAAAEQEDRLKRQMLKIDMVIKAKEMPTEKMKKLASFLGIVFFDDLGQPKGDDGVRSELMILADNDPINFSKYIDSQEVEIAYAVKRAILDAKIDLNGQQGNAIWAGGKGFIAKIPSARKPYEYLTELAMTNSDEGRAFKEQLFSYA